MDSEPKIERMADAKRLQIKSWTCQECGSMHSRSQMPSGTGSISTTASQIIEVPKISGKASPPARGSERHALRDIDVGWRRCEA